MNDIPLRASFGKSIMKTHQTEGVFPTGHQFLNKMYSTLKPLHPRFMISLDVFPDSKKLL